MQLRTILTSFLLIQIALLASSLASVNAATISDSLTINPAPVTVIQDGYYTFREDMRECASPLCGGFFVKSVNKPTTRCVDGSLQNECYVANIEWATKATLPFARGSSNLVLKGRLVVKALPFNSLIGVFKLSDAFVPAINKPVNHSLLFVNIADNGIRCITTPCFSTNEQILNSTKTRPLSSIDLSKTGASQKLIDAAYNRIFHGGLIAAGHNRQTQEMTGPGFEFVANNFYFPVKKPAGLCPAGYTYLNGICKTPIGCIAPQIELMASGGAVMIDPITGEVTNNVTKSCVVRCDPPGVMDALAHCSIFYP